MNEFKFFGKVVQAPELAQTEKGLKYCNLMIEVEKNYKPIEQVNTNELFKIVCFRQTAEDACENLRLGVRVIIKGRIQANNFLKENSETLFRSELVGEKFECIDQS